MGVLTFFLIFVSRPNAYFWASEVKHNFIKAFQTVMQDLKIKVGIFTTFLIFCFTSKCFFGLKKMGKLTTSSKHIRWENFSQTLTNTSANCSKIYM